MNRVLYAKMCCNHQLKWYKLQLKKNIPAPRSRKRPPEYVGAQYLAPLLQIIWDDLFFTNL
jgi:hypothetical protein